MCVCADVCVHVYGVHGERGDQVMPLKLVSSAYNRSSHFKWSTPIDRRPPHMLCVWAHKEGIIST